MIDDLDSSASLLRLLVSQGLKSWPWEALLRASLDKSVIVRTAAARELHVRPEVDAIFERIIPMLGSRDAGTREIAAFILGQLGTPAMPRREGSFPHLATLLSDQSSSVRSVAVSSIGHLAHGGMPKAIEDKLVALRDDASADVRAMVAYALGNSSGHGEAMITLEQLIRDPQPEVAEHASLGMDILEVRGGRVGSPKRRNG